MTSGLVDQEDRQPKLSGVPCIHGCGVFMKLLSCLLVLPLLLLWWDLKLAYWRVIRKGGTWSLRRLSGDLRHIRCPVVGTLSILFCLLGIFLLQPVVSSLPPVCPALLCRSLASLDRRPAWTPQQLPFLVSGPYSHQEELFVMSRSKAGGRARSRQSLAGSK